MNKEDYQNTKLPEKCGLHDCSRPCVVYIHEWINNEEITVSRCAEHYTEDLSRHEKGTTPRMHNRFHAEKDIMDTLHDMGMEQLPDESKRDYAIRCKQHLRTKGSGYGELLKEKYGT